MINGELVTEGEEIVIGGDETYVAMCYTCWRKLQRETEAMKNQLHLHLDDMTSLIEK